MNEKFGAIWVAIEEDDGNSVVFEKYITDIEKLHVIYLKFDGSFMPYSFVKRDDHQWRLPIWCPENEKAIMPTLDSAKEYLSSYGNTKHQL